MTMNSETMTKILNETGAANFAGYVDVLYVYENDATTLVTSYEWHTSSKRGFVITGRRKGDTGRMTAWLDKAGISYTIVPNKFLGVRQIIIAG